jgi:glycosyltransferase involved in cell wall biosynthesis
MNLDQPTVSVALCTYNGEKYVGQQLESIVQQTVCPDEVMVCDDGSTDATISLVEDFARQYPSIQLVRNETNLGFTRNFEQAIRLASQDLIFLSDQDDVWLPDRIRAMRQIFAADPKVGMVYANFQLTDEALQPIVSNRKPQPQLLASPRLPAQVVRHWGGISGCTIAFRSTLKPFLLPIPDAWTHDGWITLMSYVFSEVQRIEDVLMYYRIHAGSGGHNAKYTAPSSDVLKAKITRAQIKYYTEERIRWSGFHERLMEIAAFPSLAVEHRQAVNLFLDEARRRAKFAQERESLKEQPRLKRALPALRLLAAGDYGRYLNGMLTFTKDVFLT